MIFSICRHMVPFLELKLSMIGFPLSRNDFCPDSQKFQDPLRPLLPDDGPITFTHADLHRGNILISQHRPPQILAIVDWGQSGWYPDYWEYCKAAYTCMYSGEWRMQWIPIFLAPRIDEHEVFSEYIMAIGAL